MDEMPAWYLKGYNDAWVIQQNKVSKIMKLVEDHLGKYDIDEEFVLDLYKIANRDDDFG